MFNIKNPISLKFSHRHTRTHTDRYDRHVIYLGLKQQPIKYVGWFTKLITVNAVFLFAIIDLFERIIRPKGCKLYWIVRHDLIKFISSRPSRLRGSSFSSIS